MCETDGWRSRVFFLDFEDRSNGIKIVSGNNDFTFFKILQYLFITLNIVVCCFSKEIDDRIFISMQIGKTSLLYNICSTNQFGTKFDISVFRKSDLKACSFNWSFEIILNGGNNVCPFAIVLLLELLADGFNAFLDVWLLCIDKNPEIFIIPNIWLTNLFYSSYETLQFCLFRCSEREEKFDYFVVIFCSFK